MKSIFFPMLCILTRRPEAAEERQTCVWLMACPYLKRICLTLTEISYIPVDVMSTTPTDSVQASTSLCTLSKKAGLPKTLSFDIPIIESIKTVSSETHKTIGTCTDVSRVFRLISIILTPYLVNN